MFKKSLLALLIISILIEFGFSFETYKQEVNPYTTIGENYHEGGPFSSGPFFIMIGDWLHEFHEQILAAATIGILLVTAALAVYTFKLWSSASDTAKRQLRAYLGVSNCSVITITNEHIQVSVEIKNTGQTPAHKVIQTIKSEIRNSNSVGEFPTQQTDRGSTVIVPGSHITVRFDLPVTEQIINEIKVEKKSIFVWGSVSYVDIFDEEQRLEFRYRDLAETYESPDGVREFLTGWELQPVEGGNKST